MSLKPHRVPSLNEADTFRLAVVVPEFTLEPAVKSNSIFPFE